VILTPEAAPWEQHHRPWLTVVTEYGLLDVEADPTIEAMPGSGSCAMVKEELAQAKPPWTSVRVNHTCRDAPAVW